MNWKHDKCGHGYDRHRVTGINADGSLKLACLKKGEETNDAMKVFLSLTERYEGLVATAKSGRAGEIAALQGQIDALKIGHAEALRKKQKGHEADKQAAIQAVEEQNATLLSQVLDLEGEAEQLRTAVGTLQTEIDAQAQAIIGQGKTIGSLQRRIDELVGADSKSEVVSIPLPGAPAPKPVQVASAPVAAAKPAAVIVPDSDEDEGGEDGPAAAEDDDAAPAADVSSGPELCSCGCKEEASFKGSIPIGNEQIDAFSTGKTTCFKAIHKIAVGHGLDIKKFEDDFALRPLFTTVNP